MARARRRERPEPRAHERRTYPRGRRGWQPARPGAVGCGRESRYPSVLASPKLTARPSNGFASTVYVLETPNREQRASFGLPSTRSKRVSVGDFPNRSSPARFGFATAMSGSRPHDSRRAGDLGSRPGASPRARGGPAPATAPRTRPPRTPQPPHTRDRPAPATYTALHLQPQAQDHRSAIARCPRRPR